MATFMVGEVWFRFIPKGCFEVAIKEAFSAHPQLDPTRFTVEVELCFSTSSRACLFLSGKVLLVFFKSIRLRPEKTCNGF